MRMCKMKKQNRNKPEGRTCVFTHNVVRTETESLLFAVCRVHLNMHVLCMYDWCVCMIGGKVTEVQTVTGGVGIFLQLLTSGAVRA